MSIRQSAEISGVGDVIEAAELKLSSMYFRILSTNVLILATYLARSQTDESFLATYW